MELASEVDMCVESELEDRDPCVGKRFGTEELKVEH